METWTERKTPKNDEEKVDKVKCVLKGSAGIGSGAKSIVSIVEWADDVAAVGSKVASSGASTAASTTASTAASTSASAAASTTAKAAKAAEETSSWWAWAFGTGTEVVEETTSAAAQTSSAAAKASATGTSAETNAAAQAVQTGSKAAKIVGSVAGGLNIAASLYGIYGNIRELYNGDPLVPHIEHCLNIIENLEKQYARDTPSEAHNAMQKKFQECANDITDLVNIMINRHRARASSDIGVGLVSTGSGVCAVAAPFTAGASFAVGGLITGIVAGVGSAGTAITKTSLEYSHRNRMYNVLERIWKAEQRYLSVTQSICAAKKPHRFKFQRNKLCQCYMTIQYETANGVHITLYSTDRPEVTLGYNADIEIDPMARNIEISFDVRGGRQVYACDRSSKKFKWLCNEDNKYYREIFYYSGHEPIDVMYKLGGTSCHTYVYKVLPEKFDTPSTKLLDCCQE